MICMTMFVPAARYRLSKCNRVWAMKKASCCYWYDWAWSHEAMLEVLYLHVC